MSSTPSIYSGQIAKIQGGAAASSGALTSGVNTAVNYKQTITGAKLAADDPMTNLLQTLQSYGMIIDSTT